MERFDGTRTTPKFRGMLRLRIWKKMRNNVSVRTFIKKKKWGPTSMDRAMMTKPYSDVRYPH